MVFKFQRTQRVGHALSGVRQGMGKVIHGIHAPFVAGAVMVGVHNTINDRVPHIQVGGAHIDFGTQHLAALRELALAHAHKQVQVFLHGAVAVGALFARLGEGATVGAHFLRRQLTNKGLAFFDQLDGAVKEKVKVVGGVVQVVPLKAQPLNVLFDGVYILGVLFGGVGVVQTQIAHALVLFLYPKIDANGLGVANVQVAVGLRGKAGLYAAIYPVLQVFINKIVNKIRVFSDLLSHGTPPCSAPVRRLVWLVRSLAPAKPVSRAGPGCWCAR